MAATLVDRHSRGLTIAGTAMLCFACAGGTSQSRRSGDAGTMRGTSPDSGAGAAPAHGNGGSTAMGSGGSGTPNGQGGSAQGSGGRAAGAGGRAMQGMGGGAGGGAGGATPNMDGGADTVPPVKMPGSLDKCPVGFQMGIGAGHHVAFMSGGQSRSFDILLPPAKFTGPRPLLFSFHGTGLTGAGGITDYGLKDWADAGFIIVAPDSNGNGWLWPVWDSFTSPTKPPPANADLALFDDLLQCVAANQNVDAKRVYVAGQSAGGAMSNFVLGRRSTILAGGVPESGPFDLTQPDPPDPIDPMMVVVTWGGDNDMYSGSTAGVAIANIGYAEQASIASQYWESRPGNHQIYCRGNNLGHVWIPGINPWLREVLLAHPKGAANAPGWTMPPVPSGAPATCNEAAAVYTSKVKANCATSTVAGCQAYCQLLGSCLVENGSLGPVLAQNISAVGFSQTGNVCGGCITDCEQDANGAAPDMNVLSCIAKAAPGAMCGPGFKGEVVFPTIGACCNGATGSRVCMRYCNAFHVNNPLSAAVTGCM
jgi:predicted esterase